MPTPPSARPARFSEEWFAEPVDGGRRPTGRRLISNLAWIRVWGVCLLLGCVSIAFAFDSNLDGSSLSWVDRGRAIGIFAGAGLIFVTATELVWRWRGLRVRWLFWAYLPVGLLLAYGGGGMLMLYAIANLCTVRAVRPAVPSSGAR